MVFMILKLRSKLVTTGLLLFIFLVQSLAAQDKILKIGGITLEGSVDIRYQDLDDLVSLDNEVIPIQEIQSIELQFGKKLYPKRLYYYNTRLATEIEKYALLSIVIDENIKLYSYQGNHFKYALFSFEKLYALQDLDNYIDTGRIESLKKVLSNNLEDCITPDEISSVDYKEEDLANLISKSNRCKEDSSEITNRNSAISSVSVFTGLNHANLSIRSIVLTDDDIINQKNTPSNSFTLGAFFQKNLFNTQKLFFELGVSFRLLDFEISTLEKNLLVDNLSVNEVAIEMGLNFKMLPKKRFSPEITLSTYVWNFRGHGNLYPETSERFPAFASKYSSLFGIGGSIQSILKYEIHEKLHLFLAGKLLRKARENVFTNLVPPDLQNDINDSLMNNYTITFGITFQNY